MIKKLKYHAKRITISLKMRSIKSEIEAAEHRIAHDKELIDNLWRYRADLQSEAFWLEKNNLELKRMAA